MPDENTTNLPILDDIIKTGDTDKAIIQASRKVQSSVMPDIETEAPPVASDSAGFNTQTAEDARSDIAELFTDDRPDPEATDRSRISLSTKTGVEPSATGPSHRQPPPAGDIRQRPVDVADIDALTEEILANMMPELEQMLRKKIRQTLEHRVSGKNSSG